MGELINGQLHTQPRPSAAHVVAASNLGADLINPYGRGRGGPGGWWIIDEPEVHLLRDRDVVVPDIAGWPRERMSELPSDQRFEVMPDWICEVLSPSTKSKDLELKLPLYAQYGVAHAWLLDPIAKTLQVLVLQNNERQVTAKYQGDDEVSAEPFAAVTIALKDIWR